MDLDEEPEDFEEPSEADPKDEVDKRRWMSVPEAMEYLDYPDQRTLVARAASRPLLVKCRGDPVRTHGWRRLFSWSLWPRSASHGRLVSVLKPYRAELSHLTAKVERTRGYKDSEELPWAEAACSLLEEARVALDENDTDRAWRCFLGANRLELFGLDELGQEDGRNQGDEWEGDTGDEQNRDPLQTRARTIAREADEKLDSWRKTVVEDALGMRGELKEEVTVEEVYEAALVLHGHFHNQYHKIGMLKRQSSILAVIAFLTTIVILVINGFAEIFASDNAHPDDS